jgi:glyoxylase-like metal-dependent hydrolase (beta-lactamase superfamily II)
MTALPARSGRAGITPFKRTVGAIEVMVIRDGTLNVPLSFTLPETPQPDVTALLAAHGLAPTGMPAQTNVTLVKTGAELVLIDAGSGPNFQPTAGKLAENMEQTGLDPRSVTKVVFTHCHADHLWGAVDDFDDGERFPNASYVISAAEWNFWTNPSTADTVPGHLTVCSNRPL